MNENKTNLKVDTLQVQIRDSIKAFAERLLTALGDNLQSITVGGGSLTENSEATLKVEAGERKFRTQNFKRGKRK